MENYFKRSLFQDFGKKVLPNKVLILLGARRVGKTELIKNYLQTIPDGSYLQLNGEDINDANLLKERSVINYKRLLHNIDLLVIDEAQTIPDIGFKQQSWRTIGSMKKYDVSFSIGTNGIFAI